MDWRTVTFDWNRARAFLVTAEEGSLSAAARALHLAQPTLGRQVRALEDELGVALFERTGPHLTLTPSGADLLSHVRRMGEAAGALSLAATGRSEAVCGTVTISSTEVACAFVLPPLIAELRQTLPQIALNIVSSSDISDLKRREADIALRSVRPTEPDLIAKRVATETARLYASTPYLERIGRPQTPEDLAKADFLSFADNTRWEEALRGIGVPVTDGSFPIRAADHLVQWSLVKAHAGICAMVTRVGDAEPGVERAAPFLPPFPFEVWLVAHRELLTSRRVRVVYDHIADWITALPPVD